METTNTLQTNAALTGLAVELNTSADIAATMGKARTNTGRNFVGMQFSYCDVAILLINSLSLLSNARPRQ
jgi:hypothetical protein